MTSPARRLESSHLPSADPVPGRPTRVSDPGGRSIPESEPRSLAGRLLFLAGLVIAAGLLAYGWEYYRTPLTERAYAPLHDQLKPSGTLGLLYAVVGTGCIAAGVVTYSLRRRARLLGKLGKIRHWLSLHVFLCSFGPFLILLHTSFKFGGVVAIAFWSMVAVAVSGAFGRYVYVHVPRALNGQLMSLRAIEQRRGMLLATLAERSGLGAIEVDRIVSAGRRPPPRSLPGALLRSAWDDLTAPFRDRRVRRLLERKRVPARARAVTIALFREEEALERRVALIRPFQRLFHLWHLFHLPLAILMGLVVALHIGVAVAFGYAWAF